MSAVLRPVPPAARPMTVQDLDAVLAIEVTAYSFPWTRGNFIDALAAGYWSALRFDDLGALVAYAVAMPALDEMHLLNLTVAPAHEGRGHAQALLDRLQARCREAGQRSLWLEVRASNARARRLYAWRGFHEIGQRRGYYPAALGRREDAVVMRLFLAAEADDGLD